MCLNKISYTDPVYDHLFNINKKLNELKKKNVGELQEEQEDVLEVCVVLSNVHLVPFPIFHGNSLTIGGPIKYDKQ